MEIIIFMLVHGVSGLSIGDVYHWLPECFIAISLLLFFLLKKKRRDLRKLIILGLLLVVFIRADFLYSWADMKVRCFKQTGVKVYDTVEVGPEFFDRDGWPIYLHKTRPARFLEEVFSGRYRVENEQHIPKFGSIVYRLKLVDITSGKTMSSIDLYRARLGWFWIFTKKSRAFQYCGNYHGAIKVRYAGGDYTNKENVLHSVFIKKI